MELKILCKGKKSRKLLSLTEVDAFPFVYYRGSDMGEIGVGLEYKLVQKPEEKPQRKFWGQITPRLLLASYRGMKVAELIKQFKTYTLHHCWESMYKDSHLESVYGFTIDSVIGKKTRKQISRTIPENFEELIIDVHKSKIPIDYSEIEQEIRKGIIKIDNLFDSNFTKRDIKKYGLEYCVGRYAKSLIRYKKSEQFPFEKK